MLPIFGTAASSRAATTSSSASAPLQAYKRSRVLDNNPDLDVVDGAELHQPDDQIDAAVFTEYKVKKLELGHPHIDHVV